MFSSKSSQSSAASTIDKLTSNLLKKDVAADRKTSKKKTNQKIVQDKKHQKFIKYQIIKSKDRSSLTPEHQKFLKKLANKNKRLLKLDQDPELEELQAEILNFTQSDNRKQRKQQKKKFHEGLTPGLAPVDYESDDE